MAPHSHRSRQGGSSRVSFANICATIGTRIERLERLSFYLRNAINSLLRERRRAIFAVFTVAVGVAAIVGLQLTADVLESTLTTNVRTLLRGDLVVTKSGSSFERKDVEAVEQLEEEGLIDSFTTAGIPSDFADFIEFTLSVAGRTDNDAIFNFWGRLSSARTATSHGTVSTSVRTRRSRSSGSSRRRAGDRPDEERDTAHQPPQRSWPTVTCGCQDRFVVEVGYSD